MLYRLIRPAIFALDAERAHRLTVTALKLWAPPAPAFQAGPLATGDAARLTNRGPLALTAGTDGAEVVIWATA